jgi:osmotically-inducible protein OsmY
LATRQDIELRRKIQAELDWEPDLRDQEIAVTVRDGVVALWGEVVDTEQKNVAMAAVQRVVGVDVMADQLRVRSNETSDDCDVEIAHAVQHHLQRQVAERRDSVMATVMRGWITLEGAVVSMQHWLDVERCLSGIRGVRGVTNRIQLI